MNFSRAVTAINQESLNAILDEARVLRSEWREASLRSAIGKYRDGEAQAQATGNYEAAADMARNAGDVYFLLGEYKNSLEQYRAAQSFSHRVGNRRTELRASNLVGYVYVYMGQSKAGLDLARAALSYYHDHHLDGGEASRFEAEAENCAGEANASLGRLRTSIEHFQRALTLWTTANDKRGQALAILNLANA
jgi:tetratricopeptide (TPR) repeat protein